MAINVGDLFTNVFPTLYHIATNLLNLPAQIIGIYADMSGMLLGG